MLQLHHTTLGAGEPLVMLHGLLGSHQNLLPAARAFAGHFQVFAVDQRNHGHSPHHEEMHYGALADDVARFLDQQGLAAAHVLGHSMGGKTAMQLALQHSDRVRKLVVVDMAPRAYGARFDRLLRALHDLRPERFATRHEADQALTAAVPETALRQFLLKNLMPGEHGGYRWRIHLDGIAANYDRLREAVRGDTPFAGETLFLLGGDSDYVSAADRPQIQRLFPRVQFATIPGAGHWVHAEQPEAFANAVLHFLRARPGGLA
ncbi:MAG TPA: alpha/beta fold hydrolase [Verrucomicrobiae bacterium]|nr:alpha/beta fold hydrolase [Verrucomicrobiae bacterium]